MNNLFFFWWTFNIYSTFKHLGLAIIILQKKVLIILINQEILPFWTSRQPAASLIYPSSSAYTELKLNIIIVRNPNNNSKVPIRIFKLLLLCIDSPNLVGLKTHDAYFPLNAITKLIIIIKIWRLTMANARTIIARTGT